MVFLFGFKQYCGSGMFFPDPVSEFFHPGPRIQGLKDPGSRIQGLKDPGSGSASKN
jgi:hypothetical protein